MESTPPEQQASTACPSLTEHGPVSVWMNVSSMGTSLIPLDTVVKGYVAFPGSSPARVLTVPAHFHYENAIHRDPAASPPCRKGDDPWSS